VAVRRNELDRDSRLFIQRFVHFRFRRSRARPRLLIEFDGSEGEQTSLLTEVQWHIEFDEGHLIGCSFVNRQGLTPLSKHASSQRCSTPAEEAIARGKLRRTLSQIASFFRRNPAATGESL